MMRPRGGKRSDIPLLMECVDEELSSEQKKAYWRTETEYKDIQKKLETLIKNSGAEIIEKGEEVVAYQYLSTQINALTPTVNSAAKAGARQQSPVIATSIPTALQNGVIVQNTAVTPAAGNVRTTTGAATYQLMMDPRLGLVAVTSPQSTVSSSVIQTTANSPKTTAVVGPTSRGNVQVRTRLQAAVTPPVPAPRTPLAPTRAPPPPQKSTPKSNTAKSVGPLSSTPIPAASKVKKTNQKPTEGTSIGGLSAGRAKAAPAKAAPNASAPIVDLTDDDPPSGSSNNSHLADSREVTFNKLAGKTFPSLVVVARPNLRIKEIPQATVTEERQELDSKVKNVLMYTPTKFSEWLIQQGLVRSDQCCTLHYNGDVPYKLKLGMYSDASKFPYSGGYVWISECCPQRFVSVFSGSIFEGAPHPPTVLLKLIYHWCCQTNVQNVVQWVKVDNFYVKNFYTNMRCICTVAIYEKYEKMGGKGKKVEVGVISLGTTSHDGSMRQVKVEVLGVMDSENKFVRLRAVEPLQDGERNYKRRFVKILEPLESWVDKDSQIATDFTVDKGTLNTMGFKNVTQVSVSDPNAQKTGNHNIMEYLRRIVPRMFQNTLSLLSRQIIQQFLDELVWRERWGPTAPQAFDNLVSHIAEQTKLDTSDSLLVRLGKVAANPFKNWNYSAWKAPVPPVTNGTAPATKTPTQSAKQSSQASPVVPSIDMLPQSIRETSSTKRKKRPAGDSSSAPDSKKVATADSKKAATADAKKAATADAKKVVMPDVKKVIAPASTDEQTYLDSYYYGTLEGDSKSVQGEYKCNLDIKCCTCHRKFTNNISLMKHIIMHAQSNSEFNMELSDLTQCKYCLKSFDTPFTMQSHIEEVHMRANTNMLCRICEEKFLTRDALINHMHRYHVALEMPYECGVCKFRSSMHRDVVDHFYEVHNGGEKLQCPFCLKTVAVSNKGKKISANVNFFLNHLFKHQRKSIARKCNKCSMWFVHKGILKEHQTKDHNSYKGMTGVKTYVSPSGMDILMPVPSDSVFQGRGPQLKRGSPKPKSAYNMMKFESLKIANNDSGSKCCECEGEFTVEDHFLGYMQCTRCHYATCCSKAMTEHTVVFHDSKKPSFILGKVIQLPKEMHCVCGYKSSSGNRLANHLAVCKRKSAYPSVESAKAATVQSASFPPLVTLDDVENGSEDPSDRWLKAFVPSRKEEEKTLPSRDAPEKKPAKERSDPPSMLNILGLVRKESTDEPVQDRSPTESVADSPEQGYVKKSSETMEVDPVDDNTMETDDTTKEITQVIREESDQIADMPVSEEVSESSNKNQSEVEQMETSDGISDKDDNESSEANAEATNEDVDAESESDKTVTEAENGEGEQLLSDTSERNDDLVAEKSENELVAEKSENELIAEKSENELVAEKSENELDDKSESNANKDKTDPVQGSDSETVSENITQNNSAVSEAKSDMIVDSELSEDIADTAEDTVLNKEYSDTEDSVRHD